MAQRKQVLEGMTLNVSKTNFKFPPFLKKNRELQ